MTKSRKQDLVAPRKVPRQARSEFTVQAILDAATRVLEDGALPRFNTNRVAEVAGVSVGSLYQYFPSKDALMVKLILNTQERLAIAVENCVEEGRSSPLEEVLTELVGVAFSHQWESPLLAAALDHEEERLPISGELHAFQSRIVQAVAALFALHHPNHGNARHIEAAKDCVVICKALVEAEDANTLHASTQARIAGTLLAVVQQRYH
jgi:AcrR family transcriptional regulator